VLKKRKLRKIYEHKRDQVTAECRALYSEELRKLFPKSDIIRVIKENLVGWTWGAGERKMLTGFAKEKWLKKASWKTKV
jgi:hypothetical protein